MKRRAKEYGGHSPALIDRWFDRTEPLDRYHPDKFYFDEAAAQDAIDFFRLYLVHVEGEWAGQPFAPEGWQRRILRDLFGWMRKADGLRKHRICYVEIPKKNGKSTMAAGVALKLQFADKEPGAKVFSAAADRSQAGIVFELAKQMVQQSEVLSRRGMIFRNTIYVPKTASLYGVLSADVPTKHGLNIHGLIFDELHTQPNRHLWDTLRLGRAARRQPVVFAATTAGYDEHSICHEVHDKAIKVRDGIIADDTFLPVIFAAGEEDDITQESVQRKANPNFGVSVKADFLREEVKNAIEVPANLNVVKRLHFNIWTRQHEVWMPMDKWDACAGMHFSLGRWTAAISEEQLTGRPCFAGLDLASTTDLAAFVMAFPESEDDGQELRFDVLCRFWMPRENIEKRVTRDRVPYDEWAREGLIFTTEGNVVDYDAIRAQIRKDGERFDIREVAYDRWNATQLVTQLQGDGFTMVPFGQGFVSMSDPTKTLMTLVLGRRIRHGGHPVLRWMASNVTVRQDPAGNLKPDKGKSRERIDGIVALIMGIGRATATPPEGGSVYDERGILAL